VKHFSSAADRFRAEAQSFAEAQSEIALIIDFWRKEWVAQIVFHELKLTAAIVNGGKVGGCGLSGFKPNRRKAANVKDLK
jgi:hypothetical protein